ncbi:MAG: hypothetical protein AAGH41_12010 [Pseudomonadota bacterium]
MKRNFHAIDAIAYALQAGFTAIPTFLRRGWLGVVVFLASIAVFAGSLMQAEDAFAEADFAAVVYQFGAMAEGFVSDGTYDEDVDPFEGLTDEDRQLIGTILLAWVAQFVGIILMVPGFVDVYRGAAYREPGGSFVPSFGRAEISLVVAYILSFLASIAFIIVSAIPAGIIGAVFAAIEVPAAIVLPVIAWIVAVIWFSLRISLIPANAAITGQVAFGEGFSLTGGRVWKLFGTYVLLGFVFWLISLLFGVLGLAADLTIGIGFSLVVNALLTIYYYIASTAFYGRITSDLSGLSPVDDGEGAMDLDDIASDDADETEPADALPVEAALAMTTRMVPPQKAAAPRTQKPQQSYGEPMRLRDPAYVRRRLR